MATTGDRRLARDRPRARHTRADPGRHAPRRLVRRCRATTPPRSTRCSVTAGRASAWSTTSRTPRLVRRGRRRRGLPVLLTRDADGDAARLPQRLPSPWRPARRRVRVGAGRSAARTTRGSTGSTARCPGASAWTTPRGSIRATSRSTRSASRRGPGSCSCTPTPAPRRSTSVRWRRRSIRTPSTDYELAVREEHEREFNWKVFVENYTRELPHPVRAPGADRQRLGLPDRHRGRDQPGVGSAPRSRRNLAEQALASAQPGEPGWAGVAACQIDDVFIAGVYVDRVPEPAREHVPALPLGAPPDPAVARRGRSVRAYRFWTADVPPRAAGRRPRREPGVVAAQDLDICERVQRGYSAGIDTNGRLSPEHENGVFHVHRLLRERLTGSR